MFLNIYLGAESFNQAFVMIKAKGLLKLKALSKYFLLFVKGGFETIKPKKVLVFASIKLCFLVF